MTRAAVAPVALRWATAVALLALVQWATVTGRVNSLSLVPIDDMLSRLVSGVRANAWTADIVRTLRVSAASFALAMGIGVPAGYALSRRPALYAYVRPLLESYASIPMFMFYPALVALIGLNFWSSLLIVLVWAAIPVVLNSVIGFRRVPSGLEKYGGSVGLRGWQRFARLRLPAALPSIVVGAKFALRYSITATIGIEFILATGGIGYRILDLYNSFRTGDACALILITIALAVVPNALLNRIEMRLSGRHGLTVDQHFGGDPAVARPPRLATRAVGPLLVAAVVAAWWLVARSVGPDRLATPPLTLSTVGDLWADGALQDRVGETARKTLIAFVITATAGTTIGYLVGRSVLLTKAYASWILSVGVIPNVVLYPIFLGFFGFTPRTSIAFGVLFSLTVVIVYTMGAVAAVSRAHLKYAQSLSMTGGQIFRRITVPSALPEILTALRVGLGLCFLGVLVEEMFSGQLGNTGFAIVDAAVREDIPVMSAYIAVVLALSLAGNWVMGRLARVVASG